SILFILVHTSLYTILYVILYTLFFFNDTATTEIYTLSLHDALPICRGFNERDGIDIMFFYAGSYGKYIEVENNILWRKIHRILLDRKSTRLNSSHVSISYAVFCLKKKTKMINMYNIYN